MNDREGSAAQQAAIPSAAFMFWCAVVYSAVCVVLGRKAGRESSDRKRRLVDGYAGGMILATAMH